MIYAYAYSHTHMNHIQYAFYVCVGALVWAVWCRIPFTKRYVVECSETREVHSCSDGPRRILFRSQDVAQTHGRLNIQTFIIDYIRIYTYIYIYIFQYILCMHHHVTCLLQNISHQHSMFHCGTYPRTCMLCTLLSSQLSGMQLGIPKMRGKMNLNVWRAKHFANVSDT